MLGIYTSYKCRTCKKEFIIITEEIEKNRYLVCPRCSSQRIDKSNETNDLREVMKERSYRRTKGAIKQMRW
ncbi:hypothetical protein OSC52_15320 [Clostridium pasteurianum]|uniref:hypothetical protein n=1 Tax=Clostridium pasteurianum TaxID=1501 RepID=UPI0022609624|nr:hypothetical protein [Clostridium pasteurianum]UZW13206.1 hypothetical protein OSC52_15320 [Clostridium pasteurianum]